MKALDSFTVERLEEILNFDLPRHPAALEEIVALARIALAAKRAEPDYYIVRLKFNDGWGDETVLDTYETKLDASKSKDDHGGEIIPAYTTPQLNSQVPLGSWINCSDQMPEDDQVVAIVDAGHGCFYGGAVVSRSGPNFHLIGGLSAENYDGGAVVELDMEATHWMPLPAAPEKENG